VTEHPKEKHMDTTKKRNMLSFVDLYKLCELMRNNVEWLNKHQPTWIQAATYFSKQTEFVVTASNVRRASAITKVVWEGATKRMMKGEPRKRMKALEIRMAELAEVVNKNADLLAEDREVIRKFATPKIKELVNWVCEVEGMLHHLYKQLGATYPDKPIPQAPITPTPAAPPNGKHEPLLQE
jgi:uncharacterized coiled-coil protein SlyX